MSLDNFVTTLADVFLLIQSASDPNYPTVTVVSDLGFNGRAYNTSAGASTPTGSGPVMKDTDPAVMAASGTVTPSPTIFVGTPGPGRNSTAAGTSASATGAASPGFVAAKELA
jgi:hypothetical protein